MKARVVWRWSEMARVLANHGPGACARIEKSQVQHPLDGGMRRAIAMPVGQQADYQLRCRGGAVLFVKDFGTHYEAHVADGEPHRPAGAPSRAVAPGATVAGGVALGALFGAMLSRKGEGVVAGALIGGLLAALAGSSPAEERRT
jgi:hypothetical protein